MKRSLMIVLILILSVGCGGGKTKSGPGDSKDKWKPIVLLNVTSDATDRPQAVDMAMKIAGFSLDEGRQVAMFFNVKGVKMPTKAFPDDFAFQENSALKKQLAELIKRGVDVHVCPICMKAWKIEKSDLMEGAKVTTRPSLFENIGPDTAVFTY